MIFFLRDILMVIVVLNQGQRVFDGRTANPGSTGPVMDQTTRHFYRCSARRALHHGLSFLDLLGSLRTQVRP
jgi:hypothetical protein